jgi:hypothetical protein
MNSIERLNHLPETHDLIVSMRDLATSLAGDPMLGDAIMRRALFKLQREYPKRELDTAETRDWLSDCVIRDCLARSGCVACAALDDEDGDDDDVDEDEDDVDELAGEQEPESDDETIVGDQAA